MDNPGSTQSAESGRFVGAGTATRRPRVHSTGRVCAEEDCATLLSIYNPSDHCGLHADTPVRRRSRRRTPVSVD